MVVPGMFFADDIVLIGKDSQDLSNLLKAVGEGIKGRKLTFNAAKSKVMVS